MTTFKELGPVIVGVLTPTVASRFTRILTFYDGNGNDVDVVKALCRIVEDGAAWKRTDDILKRWTTANTIGDVYGAVIRVLDIPEVTDAVKKAYPDRPGILKAVRDAHVAYKEELVKAAEARVAAGVGDKKINIVQGKKMRTASRKSSEEDSDGEGSGGDGEGRGEGNSADDDGYGASVDDLDLEELNGNGGVGVGVGAATGAGGGSANADMVERFVAFVERMAMYVDVLKKSVAKPATGVVWVNNMGLNPGLQHAVEAIVQMMEYDLDLATNVK